MKCKPEDVSLEAQLGPIKLQYLYMTARMQSLVGPDMAVAAGRLGILTCVPRSLCDEDKQAILDVNKDARLSKGDIEYVEKPDSVSIEATFKDAKSIAERTGYSVIPVTDHRSKVYGFYIHNPDNMPVAPDKRNPDDPLPEQLENVLAGIVHYTGAEIISIGNSPETDSLIYLEQVQD